MAEKIVEIGSKGGMEMRSGQITEVGCTERIRKLNGLMHASRPNLELQRTRVFTKYFKEHESESQIRKRYFAMAEVYRTLPIHIEAGERLLGWQGSKLRCNNFSIESHAHWLESDFETFETRAFDPWQISAEDKEELRTEHIPYWSAKTLTSRFIAQTREPRILLESGYVDCSNYISNPGSHFVPDYHELFAIGFKGHYEKAKKILAGLDRKDPENVGKRDFYEGIMEVCLAIKEYGENLKAHAYEAAKQEADESRKAELMEAGDRAAKICWEIPETYVEGLHLMWITQLMLEMKRLSICQALSRRSDRSRPAVIHRQREASIH